MHTPSRDDVEIIAKDTVYKGYFQIDRYRLRHRTYAGGWTDEVMREVFERGHAVAVVLYDPHRDRVALIEQFRPGAYAAGWHPWQMEMVAGIIEPDESLEEVACREVEEEAGVKAQALVSVGHYLISAGGTTETCKLFCARVDAEGVDGIHGLAHEGEDIRVWTLPVAEAYGLVRDGHISNVIAVIAIQWLMLEREALRQQWGVATSSP